MFVDIESCANGDAGATAQKVHSLLAHSTAEEQGEHCAQCSIKAQQSDVLKLVLPYGLSCTV